MKRTFFILVFLLVPVVLFAQPTMTVEWDQPNASAAEAQAYIYTYFLDAQAGIDFPGVTCTEVVVSNASITRCRASVNPPTNGLHTIYLVVRNEVGSSPPSPTLRFRWPAVPGAPQNLRIVKGDS